MSKVVDERVVEMRFDNKQFESNVSTTMSTLDKLKQKLRLTEATKGLQDLGASAKKVNLSPLGDAAEQVGLKFNAMYTIADQALRNIVNSAMNAGKNIVKALTLDPVMTGFSEYETKINSVQTILANTQSKGTTIDQVNAALDELNHYADKTIYNFTEMTRNIGTFTAAGVDLETSVSAIQGIANLAAVSGSTSQQASTAMYQLSQALAAGTVKLMDWNSVVNAGMGGEVFQNALKETARVHGVAIDDMIAKEGSFRETLSNGWLTSEILTETLEKFTLAAEEGTEQWEKYKKSLMEKGYTEAQAEEILKMANTATDAATKVKTFTQLWDVLKESAQSGWTETWELIIGDFEGAKELLTPLSDFLTGFIGKMSDARNFIVGAVMDISKPWATIKEKLENSGLGKLKEYAEHITEMTHNLEDFQNVVKKVWNGDFKNSDTGRFELLEKAGWDSRVIQDLVNKGSEYKLTMDDVEASHKKFGLTMDKNTTKTKTVGVSLDNLSDKQLKNAGLTEDEIRLYRDLQKEAERTGVSIEKLVDDMSKHTGRELIFDSLKNAGKGLIAVFSSIRKAWLEVFPQPSVVRIYSIIKGLNEFSKKLVLSEETADKLKRAFKGLFSVLDIVATLVGGPLGIAFKLFKNILGSANIPILDVLANVGDAITRFDKWLKSVLDFNAAFKKLSSGLTSVKKRFSDWIDSLKEAENLPKAIAEGIVNGFASAIKFIGQVIVNLKDIIVNGVHSIPSDMAAGFANGVWNVISIVGQTVIELGKAILAKFREVLGIHSPSTETESDGENFVLGFIKGLLGSLGKVLSAIGEFVQAIISAFRDADFDPIKDKLGQFGDKIADGFRNLFPNLKKAFGNFDFGKLLSAGISGGLVYSLVNVAKTVKNITSPLEGLGEVLDQFSNVVATVPRVMKSFSKLLKAKAFKEYAKGILEIAGAFLILALAIALLSYLPEDGLERAIEVVIVIGAIFAALAFALSKAGSVNSGIRGAINGLANVMKMAFLLVSVGLAIGLIVGALAILSQIAPEKMEQGIKGLAAVLIALIAVLAVCKNIVSGPNAKYASKLGGLLLKIAAAFFVMALVVKIMGNLETAKMVKGLVAIGVFTGVIVALMAASRLLMNGKSLSGFSKAILAVGAAMFLMAITAKIMGDMTVSEIAKGLVSIGVFTLLIVALMAASKLIGNGRALKSFSKAIFSIGVCMALMGATAKVLGGMSIAELAKGLIAVGVLTALIIALMAATRLVGPGELKRLGSTLTMIAVAIGILGVVVLVLGGLELSYLAKGLVAVGILSLMMALLIQSTRGATNVKGTIVAIAIAIGVMAVAVAALSMIDTASLIRATACLGALMGMLALVAKEASKAKGSTAAIIAIAAVIALISYALYKLAEIPAGQLLPAAISLGSLLVAVAAVMYTLSKMDTSIKGALKGAVTLSLMIIPLLAFTAILALLSNVQTSVTNVLALIGLTSAMALLVAFLSKMNVSLGGAIKGIIALTAMAIPLLAFVAVLAVASMVQQATTNAILLTTMATVLTALLVVLTVVGVFVGFALAGIIALTAMAIPLLAFIGILALMNNVQNAAANVTLVTGFMQILVGLLTQLAIIGPLALIGVVALTALTVLIGVIGVMAVAIGALMEKFPALEDFLDHGLEVLNKLALGIGSMIGNLVNGFMTAATANLPEIGQQLSMFMMNVMPFITGMQMVDSSVIKGVGILAAAIAALGGANVLDAITTFLSGGDSFARLGTELSNFMLNAMPFIAIMSTVNPESFKAVDALASAILKLTAANILDAITSFISGGDDSFAKFGVQLASFGNSMVSYALITSQVSDWSGVSASAEAAKKLVELANSIPNSGGWLGKLMGDNDIGTFGMKLTMFATGLVVYANQVATVSDWSAVNSSVEAAKKLVELADSIPNSGGFISKLMGDNDIGTFGSKLEAFGTGLANYAGSVAEANFDGVEGSITAAKSLVEFSKTIPDDGGWIGKIFGDNDMATFGDNLIKFGEGLCGYSNKIAGVNLDAMNTATKGAKAIVTLVKSLPKKGFEGKISTFGSDIKDLAGNLKTYSDKAAKIDTSAVSKSVSTARQIVSFINSLNGLNTSGISTFKGAVTALSGIDPSGITKAFSSVDLSSAGASMVSGLSKGIGSSSSKVTKSITTILQAAIKAVKSKEGAFRTAGAGLSSKLASGISSNRAMVTRTCTNLVSNASAILRAQYSAFYNAGAYLATGFANGISSNTYKATAKARAMANAAKKAAEAALDEHSPSKEFFKIGDYAGQGFVNALGLYVSKAYDAGEEMALSAKSGLDEAIAGAMDLLGDTVDTQPTIRPVLDLSDVKSGSSALGDMLNFNSKVGVLANVGSISAMRATNQNGPNDDVISAIDKLSAKLGNVGNTYNSINGITYDDGSNVADAVRTLIRAAKIERRM